MKVPKGSVEVIGEDLENVFHFWNFPYFRDDADLKRPAPPTVAPIIPGFGNSYVYLLWRQIADKGVTEPAKERIEWLLRSVKLGQDAEREFKRLLAATHEV